MKWQRIALEFPLVKIATNLNIAASTVYRTMKHFEDTGEVEPHHDRAPAYDLSPSSELYVIGLILDNPSLYLNEAYQMIKEMFLVDVSPPTICRLLRSHGITGKKIRQVALQRSEEFRGEFMAQFSLYKREMFVWIVDQMLVATFESMVIHSVASLLSIYHRFLHRGKRVNALAAIASMAFLLSN